MHGCFLSMKTSLSNLAKIYWNFIKKILTRVKVSFSQKYFSLTNQYNCNKNLQYIYYLVKQQWAPIGEETTALNSSSIRNWQKAIKRKVFHENLFISGGESLTLLAGQNQSVRGDSHPRHGNPIDVSPQVETKAQYCQNGDCCLPPK